MVESVTTGDLAREDEEVLLRLVEQYRGEPIEAGTLADIIPWADGDNDYITYRYDKLEKRGYIETEQLAERATGNQIAPRCAEPTEAGEALADELSIDLDELGAEERLERLEKQQARMRETYGEAKRRIVELETEVEEMDSEVDAVYTLLRRAVKRLDGEAADVLREEVDRLDIEIDESKMQFGD